jgi:hypothetical protein
MASLHPAYIHGDGVRRFVALASRTALRAQPSRQQAGWCDTQSPAKMFRNIVLPQIDLHSGRFYCANILLVIPDAKGLLSSSTGGTGEPQVHLPAGGLMHPDRAGSGGLPLERRDDRVSLGFHQFSGVFWPGQPGTAAQASHFIDPQLHLSTHGIEESTAG